MYHLFCLSREDYLRHYHKRSNVESTFSMVKRKFGDSLRSKSETALLNETLAKLLCHNLCCLISAWYELGIEPIFGALQPMSNHIGTFFAFLDSRLHKNPSSCTKTKAARCFLVQSLTMCSYSGEVAHSTGI